MSSAASPPNQNYRYRSVDCPIHGGNVIGRMSAASTQVGGVSVPPVCEQCDEAVTEALTVDAAELAGYTKVAFYPNVSTKCCLEKIIKSNEVTLYSIAVRFFCVYNEINSKEVVSNKVSIETTLYFHKGTPPLTLNIVNAEQTTFAKVEEIFSKAYESLCCVPDPYCVK
jgi:hypothetical protein